MLLVVIRMGLKAHGRHEKQWIASVSSSVHTSDIAVTKTDVIVCTSVVGAGFSIACHFHGFHAFLFNILPFAEEQQFIRRLRFHIDSLPPDAKRDSMHASKRGMGCPLTSDSCSDNFKRLWDASLPRSDKNSDMCMSVMEDTHARVLAELRHTRSKHDELWTQYGKAIQSTFEPFPACGDTDKSRRTKSRTLEHPSMTVDCTSAA